jgi:hypothetical protein
VFRTTHGMKMETTNFVILNLTIGVCMQVMEIGKSIEGNEEDFKFPSYQRLTHHCFMFENEETFLHGRNEE